MEKFEMKPHTVKVAGREFHLAFTLRAMLEMQKRIEGFNFENIDKIVSTPQGMVDALFVLAENGAKLNGETLNVDEEWFALHIPATLRKFVSIQIAIMETLTDGMMMESEEDDERSREVDVVLQEIQKKRAQESSPGEKSQPGG